MYTYAPEMMEAMHDNLCTAMKDLAKTKLVTLVPSLMTIGGFKRGKEKQCTSKNYFCLKLTVVVFEELLMKFLASFKAKCFKCVSLLHFYTIHEHSL